MVDFNDIVSRLKADFHINDSDFNIELSKFLVANSWFGEEPEIQDGALYVDDSFASTNEENLRSFCEHYTDNCSHKLELLLNRMAKDYPNTCKQFKRYIEEFHVDDLVAYVMADFLLTELPGELYFSSDAEIGAIVNDVYDHLSKAYGEVVLDFINWLHLESGIRTAYSEIYSLNAYSDKSKQSEAYGETYYLKLLYYLFNDEYIKENDMYAEAAESKDYADTWLYLSIHFLCAMRDTDIIRILHPILPFSPEEVLEQLKAGKMTDADALVTLSSVIYHLDALRLTPHKTEGTSGVGSIKFHVPISVQPHMGRLFACAEAHFQLSGTPKEEPLIRKIQTYEQISRYMGDEIGDLFLEENFRTRSANKSFLQMIYSLTDSVIDGNTDGFHVNGYILAALARSHKGGYGEFAETTMIYLKDAKMSGYSPDFIAYEIMERGVLSSIITMLLKMICGDSFQKLSVKNQTQAIKELDLSLWDAEQSVRLMNKAMEQSSKNAMAIYQSESDKGIIEILHRIGTGEAVSKTNECLCLRTAMHKACSSPERTSCVGCQFEIGTQSTVFLMASEAKRLQRLYQNAKSDVDKERYKSIAVNTILPKIRELFKCIDEEYGSEAMETMTKVVEEVSRRD